MKHIRRFITMSVLATVLMIGTANAAFVDTQEHWASVAIDRWSQEYSLIQGYEDGTFRPDASITRGAFAGILDRFLKFDDVSPASTFSDTAGTYWEEAILKLHAAGVYLGNNGKAMASNSITRQQAVTMIARAFKIDPEVTNLPFVDEARVAEYARSYLAEMTKRGYVNDAWDGNFRPEDPITRAEIVNILNNMVHLLVQDETPVSGGDYYGSVLINSEQGADLSNMFVTGELILAPGAKGIVTLKGVDVLGGVRNFSDAEVRIVQEETGVKPGDIAVDAIRPEDVYEAGEKTGETVLYNGKKIPIYAGRNPLQIRADELYWEEDRLVYTGNTFKTRFGIDVSAYQNRASENKTIDWEAVAADGVEFVMVRIGLRGTSSGEIYADEYYRENIEGAMAAGLETGVYFFAQAITVEEAIEEAEFVLELLEDLEINGPVAYDWEMHDSSYRVYGTEPEMATACAIAFCERIAEAGYTPMIYAGQYVSYIKYDQGAIAPYLSWYPEYKSETSGILAPTFYYQMNYWQFSSNCMIDGIGGGVDGNIQFIGRR